MTLKSNNPRGPSNGVSAGSTATSMTVPFDRCARVDWSVQDELHGRVLTQSLVLGSSENADVVLEGATISRLHAVLELADDGVWVRDLESKNGTFVQDIRVDRARVPHLGRVRVGDATLIVSHVRSPRATTDPAEWPDAEFHHLVGAHRKMRALYALLAQVAVSDSPVLIGGETGSGKEVVARSIHDASPRRDGPFVVVDCAALPETLLDAELFGHARGAFTGAVQARVGAIEAANGGTVFVDEIGELPKSVQPKLLRVLEAKAIRRLGENEYRAVDVRFVFATHRDLLKMVSTGEFREDLYFRVGVLPVAIPPLRERIDDLEALIAHFNVGAEALPSDLLAALRMRPWHGNVRELRNFVDRMRTLGPQRALEMTDVHAPVSSATPRASVPAMAVANLTPPPPEAATTDVSTTGPFRSFRDRWAEHGERMYLNDLLTRHQRNIATMSREAECDRSYLYKLIRKYGA